MSLDLQAIIDNGGPWKEARLIGECLCLLGDCREVLPVLPQVEAVVTDPPYGMKWDGKVTRGKNGTGKIGPSRHFGVSIPNDDKPFDPSPFMQTREIILFGANHFPQYLNKGTFLVWLKRYDTGLGSFLSDAEVAWCNKNHGVYCFRDVSLQGESSLRTHPTQKPLGLMKWCLGFIEGQSILDPFAGSFTTGVACVQLGRQFIGIECEKKYFDIGVQRITEAVRQGQLFPPTGTPLQHCNEQGGLFV